MNIYLVKLFYEVSFYFLIIILIINLSDVINLIIIKEKNCLFMVFSFNFVFCVLVRLGDSWRMIWF